MASHSGIRTDIGKPALWNMIFAGTIMLAMLTMLVALGFSVSIGLDALDAESKAAMPIGAGASAGSVALVALILGCCVCSRRNCGRNPRCDSQP